MKTIGKFVATIRQKLFAARFNWEIFHKIFPHLKGETDHGYPFDSEEKMCRLHIRGRLQTRLDLDMIERAASRMPKAYGDAFRYLVYRDLQQRLEKYMEVAEERIQSDACDPRFIARCA